MTALPSLHYLLIGAARQGTALARYLASHGAQVVLNDSRTPDALETIIVSLADVPVKWALGGHPLTLLDGVDVVCPSGGVPLDMPLVAEAIRRGIPLSNDSQIFLDLCPCPTVGITGSAGKTTTTTLVGRMAQNTQYAIRNTYIGGNIGNPLISAVDEMTPADLAVMELSSFQLDIMTRSPHVGAVLNITPNHLDRHPSMADYTRAKANIIAFQTPEDVAVLGRDDAGAWGLKEMVKGKLVTFGHDPVGELVPGWVADVHLRGDEIVIWDGVHAQTVMSRADILLRGEHNLVNVMAACAISFATEHLTGLPKDLSGVVEAMQAGVQNFRGVAHRLEFVRTLHGADWYNDSIASAPERVMAGIRAFERPIVLLAGGRDKNLPWEDFARLVCERVDHLVLFGESARMIANKVRACRAKGGRPLTMDCCAGLHEAVQAAANVAEAGDVVLLSPGGTSFDAFRDFEARGERFKQWVLALA
ncbi:MAG: UDP-N-acetylmuramoyl-L-alanine--D-glutamate ligase [Anaerolineales bacterium]|nr:UDP-N-acetylmuramoyl-L-alanine--D-glutamate ligase [Anaerolineales bacterium]